MEVWKQKTGTGKFISILCDDFTNEKRKRITEKEVVYAILMDPKYDQPVIKLFDVVASKVSQDALGQILRGCVIYLRK